ncbi:hypothetical protein ACFPZJ_07580 [Streptomyces bullii]|uniref:Uncharacterized protein n=1 Tax=Streptomyces bullii TaxID=349910 RepID=A0ABW0UN10_9ACTN
MPAEIKLPVHVRAGDTEACWGSVTVSLTNGRVEESTFRREMAAFLRAAADHLEKPGEPHEEVPDATAHG